jgi:outer membrane protein assembly factor BamB
MSIRLLALPLLLLMTTAARAEDWPGWLGPRRDGSTTEKIAPWKGDLKILWKKPVGEGHSSPVVADGKVFLHTKVKDKTVERIEAFDAATGDDAWTRDYERGAFTALYGNGPRGTPSVVGGKLYANGITGIATCLDIKDGSVVWQVDTLKTYGASNLFFGVSVSPLVDDGKVHLNVGGKGASLVALDSQTGKTAWQALDDKASYSSPILTKVDGKAQLVYLTGSQLRGVDPKNGASIWEFPFKDTIFESSTTPVRVGDVLFGSSITLGSVGLKLKKDGVDKLWTAPGLTCYFSTPVAVDKNIYAVTGGLGPKSKATLHCIDPDTGKSTWKRDNVGKYHASLTRTADNKLLLVEEEGALVLVDANPKEYRELARAKICGSTWAHPAIAGGRFYIRDNNNLVCVELPK